MNPLYPALARLPFPGFKAYSLHFAKAVQFGPLHETPKRGKPLLRQGTDGNRSPTGDISLNGLTEAPAVFPAFAVGRTASP